MTKAEGEIATTEAQRREISIANVPGLVDNLRNEFETSQPEYLYTFANELLDQNGIKSSVNKRPALVTEYACEIPGDSVERVKTFYARVAKFESKDAEPFIVFGETPDKSRIITKNPTALTFSSILDQVVVQTARGLEPIQNTPEQLMLVSQILENIGDQYADARANKLTTKKALSKTARKLMNRPRAIYNFYSTDKSGHSLADERREKTAAIAGIALVAYGHLLFTPADAKLFGIPLPQPIEGLVDWNNHIDHVAQGFPMPSGAAPIVVGQPINEVPVLSDYDTSRAPNASYVETMSDTSYSREMSKPGLYESDYDSEYRNKVSSTTPRNTSAEFDKDSHCYPIEGNYTQGKTYVFTQTPRFNQDITLNVKSAKELDVCLKNPDAKNISGSLFIYQNS